MTETVPPASQAKAHPRLKRTTATEMVTDAVRAMILSTELRSGELLRQDELAKLLGISRTPLREALNCLASEGLVRMDPHKGAVVSRPSPEELLEIYEVRSLLEADAGRRAVAACTPTDIADLRAILASDDNHDPAMFARANASFHGRLYEIASNSTLADIITGLRNRAEVYIRQIAASPTGIVKARAEHAAIVKALAERDEDLLVEMIEQHLQATVASVAAMIDPVVA